MSADSCTSFKIRKDDWSTGQFDTSDVAELQQGQLLFRIDRFALTANNITYAAAGDMLNYWGFFPATDGWGRIPAMGFADVIESKHPDVPVGGRYFGFFPMATHLVVEPTQASAAQFVDGVAHRKDHAPVYRQYQNVTSDAAYDALIEAGKLQSQLAQIRQEMLERERHTHMMDNWFYRILIGLGLVAVAI